MRPFASLSWPLRVRLWILQDVHRGGLCGIESTLERAGETSVDALMSSRSFLSSAFPPRSLSERDSPCRCLDGVSPYHWRCNLSTKDFQRVPRSFASSAVPNAQEAHETRNDRLEVGTLPRQERPSSPIRAEASYIGSRINVYELLARKECANRYAKLHKGSAIVGLTEGLDVVDNDEKEGLPLGPYMVATSYGSAVFFNVSQVQKDRWINVLKQVAIEPASSERKYTEEFALAISPDLPSWSLLEPDCVRLRVLDLKNLQVVAQVLAQSVALDYYSSHVERTLETFCAMNAEMADTASIARVDKAQLLRLVAENNIVMTEIISKLGVHERYDIAWKDVRYGRVWEFLRSELEMEPRFETLDMKLNLVQDNLKYFLEILQNRKSDALEWTIIILIAVEICLSLYDLLGKVG